MVYRYIFFSPMDPLGNITIQVDSMGHENSPASC